MIYNLCKTMIAKGQTAGMQEKLNVFLVANQITIEQFQELMGMLAPVEIPAEVAIEPEEEPEAELAEPTEDEQPEDDSEEVPDEAPAVKEEGIDDEA